MVVSGLGPGLSTSLGHLGCQNKPATSAFHRLFWILRRLLQMLVGQFWAWYWRNEMKIAANFLDGTSYSKTYWQPWHHLAVLVRLEWLKDPYNCRGRSRCRGAGGANPYPRWSLLCLTHQSVITLLVSGASLPKKNPGSTPVQLWWLWSWCLVSSTLTDWSKGWVQKYFKTCFPTNSRMDKELISWSDAKGSTKTCQITEHKYNSPK